MRNRSMLLRSSGCLWAVALLLASIAALAQQPQQVSHNPARPVIADGQTTEVVGDTDAAARNSWRAAITQHTPSEAGCFKASYPNLVWDEVKCEEVHRFLEPHPVRKNGVHGEVVGNTADYVAQSAGLITETLGTFPDVTGVQSEESVGVAAFGGGGILGPNEYTLQINTNASSTTSACAGNPGCTVWQQFVYATDYTTPGQATVFIEYWLLGWGASACPGGWTKTAPPFATDCVLNSSGVTAPDVEVTSLNSLWFTATAKSGGNDTAVFNDGNTAYTLTASDSVVDISSVWNESEFNIFGDAGGSEAVFNAASSITVNVALTDGSSAAPTCVGNAGTTGETNNLTLGPCSTAGGPTPSIQFDEGNLAPTITSQDDTTFLVGIPGFFQVTATSDPPSTFTEIGSLPTGVGISPSGLLSGTPASGTGGLYIIDITANNGVSPNATQTFTLTVDQAPIITSANHTTFTVGTYGFFQVVGSGYPTPSYSYSGVLPAGVTFNPFGPSGPQITGTPAPNTGGVYTITITASNGLSPNATQIFTLTVDQAPAITSANSAVFEVGVFGGFQVTATGFPTPITFSESGALPTGVHFSSSGLLSGTPAAGTQGYYNLIITASNGVSPNATQAFTLTVGLAPTITSVNHVTFTIGKLGTFNVTATGFPPPTFSETGALPSGVTLSSAGLLSGTPAPGTAGVYHIVITASNGALPNATQNFTLTVIKAASTCSLYSSSSTFSPGQGINFTAYVKAGKGEVDSPTGAVSFILDDNYQQLLGTEPLIGGVADFTAVLQAPPNKQYIRAVYSGDNSFDSCKSAYLAESAQ